MPACYTTRDPIPKHRDPVISARPPNLGTRYGGRNTMRKNCATCEHRAELNPQFRDMNWSDIPCSRCEFPDLHKDQPDYRTVLVGNDALLAKMHDEHHQSFEDRPLKDARKADLLGRIMSNIRDDKDAKLVRFIMANPGATQEEMAKLLNVNQSSIARRLLALKK